MKDVAGGVNCVMQVSGEHYLAAPEWVFVTRGDCVQRETGEQEARAQRVQAPLDPGTHTHNTSVHKCAIQCIRWRAHKRDRTRWMDEGTG